MTELLKIEWLKLKGYTAFKVLSIFFIVGVVATNYIVFIINKNIVQNVPGSGMLSFSPYNFSNTWQTTSYVTGYILMLPALLLIMLLTNEYTFKTHRQNIIDGLSRQQFISVKITMSLIFAVIATIMVFITALLFGFATSSDFSFNGIQFIGYFFLKALSYNLIAVLVGVLVKKTGFATGVFFIYMGSENIISRLLYVWSIKIKQDSGTDLGDMGDYLPMNAADGLLTFPDNPFKTMSKHIMPTDYTTVVLVLALAYAILFYFWATKKFVNSDL